MNHKSDMATKTVSSSQEIFRKAVQDGNSTELERVLQRCDEAAATINVNFFDGDGQTALHQSCMDGNLELVKLLVKFGADVRLANRDGWSALHIAAYGGHQEIALYLIANSRRPDQRQAVAPAANPQIVC